MEEEGFEEMEVREGSPAIHLLVAVEQRGGMGMEGGLPWSLAREWQHFLALATRSGGGQGVCWVLGSRSWLLHSKAGGLFSQMEAGGHRVKKIVLSRRSEEDLGLDPESWLAKSWLQVLQHTARLSKEFGVRSFWNLGGERVYRAQLECSGSLPGTRLFLTRIHADFPCDLHFPDLAPFGLQLNSQNQSLAKLVTDCQLVEEEDKDVETGRRFSEGGTDFTFHVYKFAGDKKN